MLSKKYDFTTMEPLQQQFWQDNQIYRFDPNSNKPIYSIDTPPPTVSGKLHIGHIFSYTQAEIIARYQRMQGKNVFYPFGFDDNGLPTERLVEKEMGLSAHTTPRAKFREACQHTVKHYEQEFKELWQSLGISADWSSQYETMSPLVQRISQKSFIDLVNKNKAYRKESPVLWCTHCRTSIAQAELETIEKMTTFNTLAFSVEGRSIPIATTRPELLYGCVAVFIHPEDTRYNHLIGKQAQVPLYDFNVPIYGDTRVDRDMGSGIVMCCTFGDTVDLEWATEFNLPYKHIITTEGRIDKQVPFLAGLTVEQARSKICHLLQEAGLLLKTESLQHTVGTHERCGTAVEIIPSPQWFINILDYKERFMQAADEINWYPHNMKQRYLDWVKNLKWDWCISRQRYYGVPFPVWYCQDCGKIMLADAEQLPVNPLEQQPKQACSCGCQTFIPETAVMDTWATSSLTPLINARWQEPDNLEKHVLPMTMRTQAHEIIRTWAFYTIVKSIYHRNEIPWHNIMVCGFVLAKKGEKFSKSKQNAKLAPQMLIHKYSADAVRYRSASARLGTDTFVAETEIQQAHRFLTKLWNAARFTLMHLADYDHSQPPTLLPIDKWLLEKYCKTVADTTQLLDNYEVGLARMPIDDFFWKDYCDFYLELVKDRLYKPEIYGYEARRSAQYTLYHTLLGILKLYAIYVPHITETIYQAYYREQEKTLSLHLTILSQPEGYDCNLLQQGEYVKEVVTAARKYKSERRLSLKTPLQELIIKAPQKSHVFIKSALTDILACTKAQTASLINQPHFEVIIEK